MGGSRPHPGNPLSYHDDRSSPNKRTNRPTTEPTNEQHPKVKNNNSNNNNNNSHELRARAQSEAISSLVSTLVDRRSSFVRADGDDRSGAFRFGCFSFFFDRFIGRAPSNEGGGFERVDYVAVECAATCVAGPSFNGAAISNRLTGTRAASFD